MTDQQDDTYEVSYDEYLRAEWIFKHNNISWREALEQVIAEREAGR